MQCPCSFGRDLSMHSAESGMPYPLGGCTWNHVLQGILGLNLIACVGTGGGQHGGNPGFKRTCPKASAGTEGMRIIGILYAWQVTLLFSIKVSHILLAMTKIVQCTMRRVECHLGIYFRRLLLANMWGNMGAIWGASQSKILVARKPPGAMWAMGSYDCYIPGRVIRIFKNVVAHGQPHSKIQLPTQFFWLPT